MTWLYVFVIPLLLNQSLGLNVEDLPRKQNMVTNFLNKVLNQLSSGDVRLPEVDLGEYLKLSDLVGKVNYVSKELDGRKSFGFKLNTTMETLITGNYEVNLDIPGLFPIFGKGKLHLAAEELHINILLDAPYNATAEKFEIEIPFLDVDVKNTTVKLENLMNDPHLADFLNELLSNLIPHFFTMCKPTLLEEAKKLIPYFGNGVLLCIRNKPFAIDKCIEDLWKGEKGDANATFSSLVNSLLRSSKILK